MKKYLFLLLAILSTFAFSQTLSIPSLESQSERIDDLELQSSRMKWERLLQDAKQPKNSTEDVYVQRRGFNKIYENQNMRVYVQNKSIERNSFGGIWFTFLLVHNQPRHLDNLTYYSGEGLGSINCKNSKIYVNSLMGLDKKFNYVVEFSSGVWDASKEPQLSFKKYLCT